MSESRWLEIDSCPDDDTRLWLERRRVEELRRRVEELERENDSLRSRCARLEAALMDRLPSPSPSPESSPQPPQGTR